MALFGGRRLAEMKAGMLSPMLAMPGAATGYGGGTFDMDGTQATRRAGGMGPTGEMPGASSAVPSGLPMSRASGGAPAVASPAGQTPATGSLGGSLRQGFDYDAAMQRLAGEKPKQNGWGLALAILGDALTASSGGRPWAVQSVLAQRQGYQDRVADANRMLTDWQYKDYARQNEADLRASAPFTIGRDRVQFNPATGQSEVLYDGAEDFELYAAELGLEPGTDDYFRAVEDYVLRSSGPSAHSRDLALDDYRTGNDVRMENLRFGNRSRLEGLRQGNRLDVIRSRPQRSTRQRGPGRAGTDLPVVASPAEASRLPSGTKFRTPDGRVKIVP